jgi:hypothetical protein
MARVGHWSRQAGCAFSQSCSECRSGDTQSDALKRQTTAAAGSIDSKARRICASFNGDMKGLMQILGLAGPAGTYNCIFCLAHKNQTSVAGLPCLRYPPEPWASKREHLDRPLQVRDPPLRGSTEDIAARAAAYQRDAAAKKDLSSGAPEYQSCIAEPLFWSDDLVEHVSKMPLHVLLGIGTNRINRIEADALKFDEAWAMNSSVAAIVAAWREATDAICKAEKEIEIINEQISTHEVAMVVCATHDSRCGKAGRTTTTDDYAWVNRYRDEKKEKEKIEKGPLKDAKNKLEKLKVTEQQTRAKAVEAASKGPFAQRFTKFLTDLGISRQKYFGGTFIGPDLHHIFKSRENISKLCEVLCEGDFTCPDGSIQHLGSNAQAEGTERVLQAFGECYRLFSRKNALCEHEIVRFPRLVEAFMCAHAEVYADEQPTPKMHVLGWHYAEMIDRHGSAGIDSEQGIESLHPEFNYVLNLFRSMERNPAAQLEAVVSRVWARGGGNAVRETDGLRTSKQERDEQGRERSKRKR